MHSSQRLVRQGYLSWCRKYQDWGLLGEALALLWAGRWCGRQAGCLQTQPLAWWVACTLSCAHIRYLECQVSERASHDILSHIFKVNVQTLHVGC